MRSVLSLKGIILRAAAVILSAVMIISVSACGDEKKAGNIEDAKLEPNDVYAEIKIMDYGEITVKLFPDSAPKSVERFIELAEMGYYDGRTIHRVIDNYLIQGGSFNGDGTDGNVPDNQYISVEKSDNLRNFYGAVCMAASTKGSYCQFYIVDNNTPQDIDSVIETLSAQLADESITSRLLEADLKYYTSYLDTLKAIPEEVKEKYKRVGGLYELDGKNTVIGQIISGYDVLEAITASEVVAGNTADDLRDTPSKPIYSIVIETVEIVHIDPPETEETTTEKKSSKKTTTSQIVNAQTVPPLPQTQDSDGDTTVSPDSDILTLAAEQSPASSSAEGEVLPDDEGGREEDEEISIEN